MAERAHQPGTLRASASGDGPPGTGQRTLACHPHGWYVLSDEPVGLETLWEYGLRFQTEHEFKDNKSGYFELESSQIRKAKALSRLYLVVAVAELYAIAQGQEVVAQGERRQVDPHWPATRMGGFGA